MTLYFCAVSSVSQPYRTLWLIAAYQAKSIILYKTHPFVTLGLWKNHLQKSRKSVNEQTTFVAISLKNWELYTTVYFKGNSNINKMFTCLSNHDLFSESK